MNNKVWLLCGFAAGLVAGTVIAVLAWQAGKGAGAAQMLVTVKFTELASSDEQAFEAYKHESPPVAIYALSQSLKKIKEAQQFEANPLFAKPFLSDEMMLAHARLAKLYAQTGETNLAAQHITEALQCAKESGHASWFTNSDALMRFVAKIDHGAK